jgi:hypothetical protein
LYYKYYPSPLAPVPLIEQQEQEQGGQEWWQQRQCEDLREKEERVEMQLLQQNENRYYADVIPLN